MRSPLIISGTLVLFAGHVVPLDGQTRPPVELPPNAQATWGTVGEWQLLLPGDLVFDARRIAGLRAQFVFESRLHTDDPRSEQRTWSVQNAVSHGRPILVLNQQDAGSQDDDDMFARSTSWYVSRNVSSALRARG